MSSQRRPATAPRFDRAIMDGTAAVISPKTTVTAVIFTIGVEVPSARIP